MARIFISYRRDDAGYVASMVRQRLEQEFGSGAVFMDIDNIPLGVDFRQHLTSAVTTCDILVALIGETWAGASADGARRRIEDPQDFVRIEIEAALKRGIPVVPVLIDKAQLPAVHTLPETLRELAFRNAAELRAGRDLSAHLDTLTQGLRAHLVPAPGPSDPHSGPTQAPLQRDPAPAKAAAPSSTAASTAPASVTQRMPMTAVLGAGVLLLTAGIGWWILNKPAESTPPIPAPKPPAAIAATPTVEPTPTALPSPASSRSTTTAVAPAPAPGTESVESSTSVRPAPVLPAEPAAAGANPRSALNGYKIAIFYPAGDTNAGNTARAIRDALASQGVERGVELRLATAQKMRELIPPDGLEVRFDEGREEPQAQLLAKFLSARPLRLSPTLKPVPAAEPTPNFISIFVPRGG